MIALGTVQAFSLIGAEKGRDVHEMDRLVTSSSRNGLDVEGMRALWEEEDMTLLDARPPWKPYKRRDCESSVPC